MTLDTEFTPEQKNYLDGFVTGAQLIQRVKATSVPVETKNVPLPQFPVAHDPISIHTIAQDRALAIGKKLTNEELAKRKKNPFDMWNELTQNAAEARFPKGTDVFLYKFHGLFYVAPAQDLFMSRLRVPGGIMTSAQFRGVADLAARFGGGYADITTRANLQVREIRPENSVNFLTGLLEIGLISRGSGADNIRNVTGGPTAGIDPNELMDVRQLCRDMHHHILNHRELYGLPRKFNIAFDGGGSISCLEDTNDIGFAAVRVGPAAALANKIEPGVYFRLALGGITGHKDFARDTGVLLKPSECVPAADAILRAFIEHGDRTYRTKSRLKYVLDRLGFDGFLAEAQKHFRFQFRHVAMEQCDPRTLAVRGLHVGVHDQRNPELSYIGVVLPVGRMTAKQMHGLARVADLFGGGTLRLTVWQNLLISDIAKENIPEVQRALDDLGIGWSATSIRAGLVACTGNAGCKYAASNTKSHAMTLAQHLESKVALDVPLNIHLTGCHHSCAQHYIGDIGLLATKVPAGQDVVEGYHVYLGGGFGPDAAIARELRKNVPFEELPTYLEKLLRDYMVQRRGPSESFRQFSARYRET